MQGEIADIGREANHFHAFSYTFLLCDMQFFYAVGIGKIVNQQVKSATSKLQRTALSNTTSGSGNHGNWTSGFHTIALFF
ncbi:hypothetical protein IB694_05641 [Escherichia coli]|nr:hypothetical protein [Escherichia coli]